MVDSKKNTNKAEYNAFPTSTTIEPRVPRFMDTWVHDSSPLDINLDNVTSIILPPLIWLESETKPLKMSVRNIGMTCNVDAEYSGSRPSLNGSILQCPYEFSSFHFHWGTKLNNGSEHRTMGKCSPMEIHLVFYNISYSNTAEAFNAEDGKLILTYMCKLDRYKNVAFDDVTLNLKKIKKPGEVIEIDSFALSSLFDNDLQNYLMYWSVCEVIRENTVLWIISPKEIPINEAQKPIQGSNSYLPKIRSQFNGSPLLIGTTIHNIIFMLSRMHSLRGPNDQCILSNCRLAKLSGGNKVLRVTQHSMDQKKSQSMEEKDNIALATPEQKDIPENMVKSETSAQTMEKEPEQLPNNSNIDSGDVVKKETVVISVVTTAPIVNPIMENNDCFKKYNTQSAKSFDLEDQRKDVEHIFNLTKPLCTKNKEKNILNDVEVTKDMVISSIDSLMIDLTNDDKVELKTCQRPEVQKTHREGVRMNATALRREMHIKNKDITSHDPEDQREEMESVSENFESVLNLMKPLDVNNKDKNVPNVEQIKNISCIDNIIPDSTNDDKVELKTSQRPSVLITHREGVRMNATALRREMHIKNRQQKNIENMKKKSS